MFSKINLTNIPMSSLIHVLYTVTTPDIQRAFGELPSSMVGTTGPQDKYSNGSIVVQWNLSSERYTLYTANGQWRIGGAKGKGKYFAELVKMLEKA